MSGAKTRGAGGADAPWKGTGNGETARPVHVWGPHGRHASPFYLTPGAAHRAEQSALVSNPAFTHWPHTCPCTICDYRPRHAAPLGPTFPLAP